MGRRATWPRTDSANLTNRYTQLKNKNADGRRRQLAGRKNADWRPPANIESKSAAKSLNRAASPTWKIRIESRFRAGAAFPGSSFSFFFPGFFFLGFRCSLLRPRMRVFSRMMVMRR